MAIVIDHKIYRNIQEQVEKNKRDIAAWSNIQFTLNSFGITVLGRVDAEADIPEGTYSYGDAYLVGEEEPYDIYIYTRDGESGEFINMGPLSIVGPQGAKGDQGDAGTITVGRVSAGDPGTNPIITNSGTAQNAVLNFVIPRGLTGATGAQGNVGPKGETGERGPIGLTGPQGDPGQSFMIISTITNTSQLPDPTQTPRNHAYVYKDGDQLTPDLIYFITGEVGSEVWSYASFAQTGTTVSVNGNPVSTFNADTKQDALTFDNIPTENSNNPVKSGGIFNALATKIDTQTANTNFASVLTQAIAAYNPSVTYNTNAKVRYNGFLYTCKQDGVTGTWDSSKWTVWTLADVLQALQSLNTSQTAINSNLSNAINGKYTKPSSGIPAGDLASAVQTSLGKADTAVQPGSLLDLIYPVGSIYTSANNTSPATLFGGTWAALNSGNTIKLPKGDLNVNTKSSTHSILGDYSLKWVDSNSGVQKNNGALSLYEGGTANYNQYPSGSAESRLAPANLYATMEANTISVYMWQRTS